MTKNFSKHNASVKLSYNYTQSTFQFDLRSPDISVGDQTYYTPVHQAVGRLRYSCPKFSLDYTHRIQSGVETIIDPLDGFHLANLQLKSHLKNLTVFFEVNNIWNANYRVIERRVMPGRNYNIGVNFKILEKIKSK